MNGRETKVHLGPGMMVNSSGDHLPVAHENIGHDEKRVSFLSGYGGKIGQLPPLEVTMLF